MAGAHLVAILYRLIIYFEFGCIRLCQTGYIKIKSLSMLDHQKHSSSYWETVGYTMANMRALPDPYYIEEDEFE